ncbi:MAG: bifunctional hydroxymethylpyrimidine kinase/phosphomethylpyrimidine kinase [Paraprevotella sp.]|nr:bifunctional hydroxymethylpyrimidine kinase/phosphomethylpyrimidine kinase [Paraprevotella sp.]
MIKYTTILTIAGSDCSGGAGIQADIKTISALGGYAASAITAITVQNTCGVKSVFPIPADIVKAQIKAVTEDLDVDAIKIGMVTDDKIISAIAEDISVNKIPIVFDPVLVSSSGHTLVAPQALALLRRQLIPSCTLVTPNLPEAEVLAGMPIQDINDMREAGLKIRAIGCQAVLIKGGHLSGNDMTDLLITGQTQDDIFQYHSNRIDTKNTHGTGCTLSSAIAVGIAQGLPLPEAVEKGKRFLTDALWAGKNVSVGKGHGPLNHFFNPQKLMIK